MVASNADVWRSDQLYIPDPIFDKRSFQITYIEPNYATKFQFLWIQIESLHLIQYSFLIYNFLM